MSHLMASLLAGATTLRVVGAALLLLAAVWLRIAWEYAHRGRCSAPVRWYTAYTPPILSDQPFPEEPHDLAALNRDYCPRTGHPRRKRRVPHSG